MMGDVVVHASGLRTVAVATVVGLAFAVLRSALEAVGPRLDPIVLEHARTSIGLCFTTIAVLWIWGAIGAAWGDDRKGAMLFSLAATFAVVGIIADVMVVADPLIDPGSAWSTRASSRLTLAGRVCWGMGQLLLSVGLARRAWQERRGGAMAAALIALVIAVPMLAVDPVALALQFPRLSSGAARFLGIVPMVVVGASIAIAIVSLPKPKPSAWRGLARALVLTRAALGGIAFLAAVSLALVATGKTDPAWLRVALTGPLVLLGIAAAVGAFGASRLSIRWARASLLSTAILIIPLVLLTIVLGALVPFGVVPLPPRSTGIVAYVGLGLVAVSLALLMLGCSRVDRALKSRGVVPLVALVLAVLIQAALVPLQQRGIAIPLPAYVIPAVFSVLVAIAVIATLLLLGKSAAIAEARDFSIRVQAARNAAKQAAAYGRRVHEQWRASKSR